jgi:hypothetical protein
MKHPISSLGLLLYPFLCPAMLLGAQSGQVVPDLSGYTVTDSTLEGDWKFTTALSDSDTLYFMSNPKTTQQVYDCFEMSFGSSGDGSMFEFYVNRKGLDCHGLGDTAGFSKFLSGPLIEKGSYKGKSYVDRALFLNGKLIWSRSKQLKDSDCNAITWKVAGSEPNYSGTQVDVFGRAIPTSNVMEGIWHPAYSNDEINIRVLRPDPKDLREAQAYDPSSGQIGIKYIAFISDGLIYVRTDYGVNTYGRRVPIFVFRKSSEKEALSKVRCVELNKEKLKDERVFSDWAKGKE